MTKEEQKRELLIKSLNRELYKKSFYEFFKASVAVLEPQTDWKFGWYIEYICNTLQNEIERIVRREKKDRDILLNVPPRFSKSNIISIVFPVWIWIIYPECRILTISHSDQLTVDHSSSSLRLLSDPWFNNLFPELEISKEQSSKSFYANTKGGKRLATSTGSNIIGHSCNVLILDDPNKDSSAVNLENTIKTYRESIYSRLNNPELDIRIILQQRLGENDLTGWCLRNAKDQYKHICLPAELTNNVQPQELSGQYVDGLLDPLRFNRDALLNERLTKGSWGYSSQFLLSPTSQDGDIIKRSWFDNPVESAPVLEYHFFIDTAFTKDKTNDPSAILIAGLSRLDRCIYIKEAIEVWLEFPQLISKINELAKSYPKSTKLYIEPKANGLSLIQSLMSSTDLNVV
ncbi:MAG: hypothetical protein C0490_24390, partial [Marivirga sp.]|nr:hypothetical protein [Marivirga sp.]